jgi:hypothetical protein
MSLRRFQNLQIGALTAQRMNELVDAVTRLQQRIDMMPTAIEPIRQTILVQITGSGIALRREGCEGGEGVAAVSYPFGEVTVTIKPDGNITGASCMSYEFVEGGIHDGRGAVLLALEEVPSLNAGQVVVAHYCAGAVTVAEESRQMVYVAATGGKPAVDTYTIISSLDVGFYNAVIIGATGSGPTVIENLYETNDWYGAMAEPTNPCAELVPRALRPGDVVFGFTVGSNTYTCAPSSFGVICQDCSTNPGGALAATFDEGLAQMNSAEIMLRG